MNDQKTKSVADVQPALTGSNSWTASSSIMAGASFVLAALAGSQSMREALLVAVATFGMFWIRSLEN